MLKNKRKKVMTLGIQDKGVGHPKGGRQNFLNKKIGIKFSINDIKKSSEFLDTNVKKFS